MWTDLVLKTFQGALHHDRVRSAAAPAAAATSSPSRSTCATPAGSTRCSGSPRSAAACCPAAAAPNDSPAPSAATARWKSSSPATTTTPTRRRTMGLGHPGPARRRTRRVRRHHRRTPRIIRPHIARVRQGDGQPGRRYHRTPTSSPLTASSPTRSPSRVPLPRRGCRSARRPGRPRRRVPAGEYIGIANRGR